VRDCGAAVGGSGGKVGGPVGDRAGAPSRDGVEVESEQGCEDGWRHVLGELDRAVARRDGWGFRSR
jgi:hypothetical protein